MWPAFPASDYYGGPAPPRPDRSTVDPARPVTLAAWRRGEDRDGSRVHCDSLDGGGARLCPCGLTTDTSQHFHRGLPVDRPIRPRSSPPTFSGCAPPRPLSARFEPVQDEGT